MREVLSITRAQEYFTLEGLRTLTGLPEPQWGFAIVKELLDNALDAIDQLEEKRIDLLVGENSLEVYDNFGGIPSKVLDKIHDFNIYVSDKRGFRSCTRGYQGNALKTIIAIAYLQNLQLNFVTNGEEISYQINQAQLQAGIVSFKKTVKPIIEKRGGVILKGPEPWEVQEYKAIVFNYYLANPDVTFTVNEEIFPALVTPLSRSSRMSIHWYDFKKFNELLQAIALKDPERTVRQFGQIFSGTQRILSKLEFPFKKLADFAEDEDVVRELLTELKANVKKSSP